MASAKKVFKALPHVNEVWVDNKGDHHLQETMGATKYVRGEEDFEDNDEEERSEVSPNLKDIQKTYDSLNEKIESQDDIINELLQNLEDKKKEIDDLNESIRSKNNTIATQEEALKAKPKK